MVCLLVRKYHLCYHYYCHYYYFEIHSKVDKDQISWSLGFILKIENLVIKEGIWKRGKTYGQVLMWVL